MNSEFAQSAEGQQMEASHFERLQPVDLSLTQEQYLIIQHYLPKKYALIEHKHIKKGVVSYSAVKLGPEDVRLFPLRHRISHGSQEMLRILSRSKAARSELSLGSMISTSKKSHKSHGSSSSYPRPLWKTSSLNVTTY